MQNRKIAFLLVGVMSFFFQFSYGQSSTTVLAYIARYKDLAMAEMKRTGIPAAITLAQGIHETEAGTSDLVRRSNNHFGIKCKDNWTGESVSHDDDARGECFRKYGAAEDSYRDHSDFLKNRSNYASLFQLDPTDYRGWARGLKRAGYATNPQYAQILIRLIDDYHLEDYTLIAMGKMEDNSDLARNDKLGNDHASTDQSTLHVASDQAGTEGNLLQNAVKNDVVTSVVVDYPEGEFKINETRVVYIRKGTSYLTVAQQYEIPLSKLFDFNDLEPQEIAADDQLFFIQRKRKTGEHEFHIVQPGESLRSISQTEAIRMASLLDYNHLAPTMQPAVGETLYLRSRSNNTPRLSTKVLVVNR